MVGTRGRPSGPDSWLMFDRSHELFKQARKNGCAPDTLLMAGEVSRDAHPFRGPRNLTTACLHNWL